MKNFSARDDTVCGFDCQQLLKIPCWGSGTSLLMDMSTFFPYRLLTEHSVISELQHLIKTVIAAETWDWKRLETKQKLESKNLICAALFCSGQASMYKQSQITQLDSPLRNIGYCIYKPSIDLLFIQPLYCGSSPED